MRYAIEGEPVELEDFIDVNELDGAEAEELLAMVPGETKTFGGGASAEMVLECI